MRHIVSISGGKDSTALALRLRELNPDTQYEFICTPTGNEPDEVFTHLDKLQAIIGPIKRLAPKWDGAKVVGYTDAEPGVDGLADCINRNQMIPNFRSRFCTRQLKIEPIVAYMRERVPCTNYVGLRADEESRKGLFGDWEGITTEHPFKSWGWRIDEVMSYLKQRGVTVPRRTDCKLCFWQKLLEWKLLYRNDPDGFLAGAEIERERGHTFRSNGRDTWPAALYDLKLKFDEGHCVRGEEDYNQRTLFNCDMDAACRVCSL